MIVNPVKEKTHHLSLIITKQKLWQHYFHLYQDVVKKMVKKLSDISSEEEEEKTFHTPPNTPPHTPPIKPPTLIKVSEFFSKNER